LELSQKHGADQIWKDLGLIIYASYPVRSSADLQALLKPLTEQDRPFRFTALELSAMYSVNEKKYEEALESLGKILDAPDAPKTMKERIAILTEHIKNYLPKEQVEGQNEERAAEKSGKNTEEVKKNTEQTDKKTEKTI
jgi:hypothetical protein